MQMRYVYHLLPKDDTRHTITYLIWACLGVACVQCIVAAAMVAIFKKLHEVQKVKQQQQGQQQGLEAVQLYGTVPPPLPRYPANAPEGYMPLPPSPPGSYPHSVPPPPAGDYPHSTPGFGTAPLLAGQVSSTAVPLGSGGTALPVPQQQPTVV